MSQFRTTAASGPKTVASELEYKIETFGGFDELIVTLKAGQKIKVEPGCVSYLDGELRVEPDAKQGVFSGFRRIVGGEQLVRVRVLAPEGVRRASVTLAPRLPGSVRAILLRPGERWWVRPGAMLAFTEGVTIEEKVKMTPSVSSTGAAMNRLSLAEGASMGMAWIAAYGGVREHRIPEGKSLHVDHGMFLAAPSTVPLSIELPGSLGTKIFTGEGLITKVQGGAIPSVVWTQSRSLQDTQQVLSQKGGTPSKKRTAPKKKSDKSSRS